jgi:hypothetical protein
MPVLADLEAAGRLHHPMLAFGHVFAGTGVPPVTGSHARSNYKNFVRVVDTSIRRYESARTQLQLAVDRPPQGTGIAEVVRATSDFEAVFNLVHRALTLLLRLKEAQEAPVRARDLLPFDEDAIQRIRNVSEHIDRALQRGEIGREDDVMVRVWREGATFAGERVSYATLAGWLRRLHTIAQRLIDHDSLAAQRPVAT